MSDQPGEPGPDGAADVTDRPDPSGRIPDPDLALLRRHVAGDPAAFAELFRANADRLWSVAFRLLHDAEDAADAVQEAMLSAHRRAATFRGESTVRTWLHRITVNAALDRLRRQAARPSTVPMPTTPDGAEREPADPRDAHAELLEVPVGTVKSRAARGRARLAGELGYLRPGNDPAAPTVFQEGGR